MEKLDISNEIRNEIYDKYKSGVILRKIVEDCGYSFTVVQKLVNSFDYENQIKVNYPQKDGYNMIAVCNQTQKEIKDYKNESGAIAEHVFKLYVEEAKNSKYIRKSKEYKTGKFWYDEYFTFEYRKIKEVKKCYYCSWTTEDTENLSGAYEKHLLSIHNKTIGNYLIDNPNDIAYFKHLTPDDAVTCAICGEKLRMLNYKHLLNKHNISLWEYKLQYGTNDIVSPSTKSKLNNTWNLNLKNQGFKRISSYETEILSTLNKESLVSGDRIVLNGLEIDILDTKLNIGFEINGIYYHSENKGGKDKNYHLNKQILANKEGVELIHIFEDELVYKKEIVMNKIKYALGINTNEKIFARHCEIKIVDSITINNFYNTNHIQGAVSSIIHLGAYYNNILVGGMSFDNKRNMNKEIIHDSNTYELTRFATNNNYIVIGIGGKLLNYFIKNYSPKRIISFADRRWTINRDNNFYTKIGFKLLKVLKPDYSYVNGKIDRYRRYHKFNFGKNKLKEKYPEVYDENKTEWEMMQELGYDRIWDCGKFKYELNVS